MKIDIKLKDERCRPERHGNWIDCFTRCDVAYKAGDVWKIPLGFCINVGKDKELLLLPRSSFFLKTGMLVANSMGIIDEEYCGDGDEVQLLVYCTRAGLLPKYTRVAQFKIVDKMEPVHFNIVEKMAGKDRGGFGSTDIKG